MQERGNELWNFPVTSTIKDYQCDNQWSIPTISWEYKKCIHWRNLLRSCICPKGVLLSKQHSFPEWVYYKNSKRVSKRFHWKILTICTSVPPALIAIFTIEYQRQLMELRNDCSSQLQFNLQECNLQAAQLICPRVFSKAIHILLQHPVHYWRNSLQSQWQKFRQVQF